MTYKATKVGSVLIDVTNVEKMMRTSVIILSCPSGCVPGDEFAPNGHLNIILTLHTIDTSKNFKTDFIFIQLSDIDLIFLKRS